MSFTTIIAAFLAGLGVGNLLGGSLADRLGPRRALRRRHAGAAPGRDAVEPRPLGLPERRRRRPAPAREPIPFDRDELLARFDELGPADAFGAAQRERLREFFTTVEPGCAADGEPTGAVPADAVNRDLEPRDEYFLNQPGAVATRRPC